jgi:hypothetical protein
MRGILEGTFIPVFKESAICGNLGVNGEIPVPTARTAFGIFLFWFSRIFIRSFYQGRLRYILAKRADLCGRHYCWLRCSFSKAPAAPLDQVLASVSRNVREFQQLLPDFVCNEKITSTAYESGNLKETRTVESIFTAIQKPSPGPHGQLAFTESRDIIAIGKGNELASTSIIDFEIACLKESPEIRRLCAPHPLISQRVG